MKTVIMAGGKGTRISSIAQDIPKPMIKIGDKPVLEHEINCLRRQGFTDLILTISHLGNVIKEYFGNGSRLGVNITYFEETVPLGNAGALLELKNELSEDFLLINGDVVFDIDFSRMYAFHKVKNAEVTLFTHPNSHPYDSGLLIADKDMAVTKWLTKEDVRPVYYKNRVNAGIHIISPKIFKEAHSINKKIDLDRDILRPLAGTGKMFCYDSPEYVKDMGTPDRYLSVQKDFQSGIIQAKNLENKQKAVFLDRDGTLNHSVGFLRDIRDFQLLDGVEEAINLIHSKGYLCIVVTNQPVIARGEITETELDMIHNKMETLLGLKGAYIDGLYYCPHHPDRGFEGEIPELKIDCDCRKPKPGMLLQAAEDFHISLQDSWMIGDGANDILAGKSAGCSTALIASGKQDYGQNKTVGSLGKFAEILI